MDILLLIESSLCAVYVIVISPLVSLGNAWMERMDRLKAPERHDPNVIGPMSKAEAAAYRPEPTVADIRPRGYIQVMAMGPGGKWETLHDYPVRFLPPYIKPVNDKGEGVR